jgi:hypothetical protein
MKSTHLSALLLAATLAINLRAADSSPAINTLTDAEKAAGWKLLFDGKDFNGWRDFKHDGVQPGWQIQNGLLVNVDKKTAGNIITTDKFDWFELQLDYNMTPGGNSGIMYHVVEEGKMPWETGPEFQLLDNLPSKKAAKEAAQAPPGEKKVPHELQLAGWLYQLYQPDIDPQTGEPIDATKPPGEWNHVRILISPEKCVHEMNGVKYLEYVLNSDDFKQRVAKSKYAKKPFFAKSDTGYLSLQGDHGKVFFRNIKIRPIAAKGSGK